MCRLWVCRLLPQAATATQVRTLHSLRLNIRVNYPNRLLTLSRTQQPVGVLKMRPKVSLNYAFLGGRPNPSSFHFLVQMEDR